MVHRSKQPRVGVLARGLVLAVLIIGALAPVLTAQAAAGVVVSGRIYNATTGQGYGNVSISLCGAVSATTAANGNWQATLAAGTPYCARVTAGAPAGLAGPVTRNNPEVGVVASYENQLAGTNCYHNAGCDQTSQNWDRVIDGGLDFIYSAATPTPAAPAATPTPSPSAAPAAFMAQAEETGSSVDLSWPAGADGSTYHVDRSLDQQTWDPLADNLTDTTYIDKTTAPNVHYYYRLQVVAADGTTGDYLLADITTRPAPSVEGASTEADTTLTSTDHLAVAMLSPGTVPDDSICKVTSTGSVSGGDHLLVVGPYQLSCTGADGTDITDFKHPVKWRFSVADKMGGLTNPQGAHYASDSDQPRLQSGSYNKQDHTFSTELPGTDQVAVLASAQDNSWMNYAVVGGAIVAILIVLALMPIRTNRKRSYQDYLRSKYYNL